ncbi:MAG: hypothetical protein BAJATHORv1_90045 [Candidatus Thorarchaeota archaeon]|nr:MAG: hypothetical protein BAJATHORv1_90045 [Candidatus Thorarchaeota archaeon]
MAGIMSSKGFSHLGLLNVGPLEVNGAVKNISIVSTKAWISLNGMLELCGKPKKNTIPISNQSTDLMADVSLLLQLSGELQCVRIIVLFWKM